MSTLLAIDTATEACSVALWRDGAVRERFEVAGREHSARLPALLHALLAEAGLAFAQLDGIACGIGPGSFAGVRIGVAYVKGLALGLDRPVVGVSSLAMLAQGAIRAYGAREIVAAIDARMNEVYVGAYVAHDGLARAQTEAVVAAPERVSLPPFGQAIAVGSGWDGYGETLRKKLPAPPARIEAAALPRAQDALSLALPEFRAGRFVDAARLVPLYLRNRVALTLAEQQAAKGGR